MRRIVCIILVVSFVSIFLIEAEAVSLRLLAENPQLYDLKEVEITAEVLDTLSQAKGTWLNLVDETASIGVWVDKDVDFGQIWHRGSYKADGDLVRVKGIFHASCPNHMGQTDIHVQDVTILRRGSLREDNVPGQKKRLALIWLVFCMIIFIIYLGKGAVKKKADRT